MENNFLNERIDEMRLVRKHIGELSRADFLSVDSLCDRFATSTPISMKDDWANALKLISTAQGQNSDAVLLIYAHAIFSFASGLSGDKAIKDVVAYLNRAGKKALSENLLQTMLEKYDSISVMRMLADMYEDDKKKQQYLDLLEKIALQDEADYESCLRIASETATEDDQRCEHYYQMGLMRLLAIGNYSKSIEVFRLMINTFPSNISKHLNNLNKIIPHLSAHEKFDLFAFLLKKQEKNEGLAMESIVLIIKAALRNEVVLITQLFLLIKAYREMYKDHPALEEYLLYSGLLREVKSKKGNKLARDVLSKLELFEKYISLVPGVFVRHNTFGEGVVRGTTLAAKIASLATEPKLKIDFKKKPGHEMTFRIAVNSLHVLKNDHLTALKAFNMQAAQQLLESQAENRDEKLLTAICNTLERPAQRKDITKLMVPDFFKKEEWTTHYNRLKQFAIDSHNFYVRDGAIWFSDGEEDDYTATLRQIRSATKLPMHLKLLEHFFLLFKKETLEKKKPCIDILETIIKKGEEDAIIYLAFLYSLQQLKKQNYSFDYNHYYSRLFSVEAAAAVLEHVDYPHIYAWMVGLIKRFAPEKDFISIATQLLLITPKEKVYSCVDALIKHHNNLEPFYSSVAYRYEEYPATFLYIVKHALEAEVTWINKGEALAKCIRLLMQFHRGIADFASGVNKRLFNLAVRILFEDEYVFHFLKTSNDKEEKEKIFLELEQCSFLENYQKIKIRQLEESIKN